MKMDTSLRGKYDISFIFAESPEDSTGRRYAEKLAVLLSRFASIKQGCLSRRKPSIYLPPNDYISDREKKTKATSAFMEADYIFVIATPALCSNKKCVENIKETFSSVIEKKKAERRLIPVFVTTTQKLRIPSSLVPFGLEDIVGINIYDIVPGNVTLLDIDACAIKQKHLNGMCLDKFSSLLNHSFKLQHIDLHKKLNAASKSKRDELYQFARAKLAEIRANEEATLAVKKL